MAQIKDLKRMCGFYEDCTECGVYKAFETCGVCFLPDSLDEIVDKWVKEHPAKTYAMDFFEKFPNALKYNNRPAYCRASIYGDELECIEGGCDECWNQEMKGE